MFVRMMKRMNTTTTAEVIRRALLSDIPALRRRDQGARVDRGVMVVLVFLRRLAEQVSHHLEHEVYVPAGYGVPWVVKPLTSSARAHELARSLRGTITSDSQIWEATQRGAKAVEDILAAVAGVAEPGFSDLVLVAMESSEAAGVVDPAMVLDQNVNAAIGGAIATGSVINSEPIETADQAMLRMQRMQREIAIRRESVLRRQLDAAEAAIAVTARKLRAAAEAWTGPGIMKTMFLDFLASEVEIAAELATRNAVSDWEHSDPLSGEGQDAERRQCNAYLALLSAIAARPPATTLATGTVRELLGGTVVVEWYVAPDWYQARISQHRTGTVKGAELRWRHETARTWSRWGQPWGEPSQHMNKPARAVSASEADADPATRGPIGAPTVDAGPSMRRGGDGDVPRGKIANAAVTFPVGDVGSGAVGHLPVDKDKKLPR